MSTRATMYGLVIAAVGFLLTRFTVTLAATDTSVEFLFAGIIPLFIGLSLTVFGVILAVGAHDEQFVRTTAVWCLLGTITMLFLVVLTLLGTQASAPMDMNSARQETSLSNFLIGGAVGGTLTGLYAAQNRRQRVELRQQANRLVLLNRLLRDEVINAASAIKGHTDVLGTGDDSRSIEVIADQADDVIETVEDVKYLSETADKTDLSFSPIDVGKLLERELDRVREAYPEADVSASGLETTREVRATVQLSEVFHHLLENAAEYGDENHPEVDVTVESSTRVVKVKISDNGPGLPEMQQALLETGEIAEFDDPTTGFGLNIVRLLVESFDGRIRTTVSDRGSTVAVTLPRSYGGEGTTSGRSLTNPGVSPSRIGLAVGASLTAGLAMGLTMLALGGDVPVIGALYGAENVTVAVISHEFHSVVFGLTYVAVLSALPATSTRCWKQCVGIALGFGVALWLLAAGLLMPLWLQLVGIEAPVPNLTMVGFVAHAVWGLTLGSLYQAGSQWLGDNRYFEQPLLKKLVPSS